ncbi:APO protein 3, mitochondrial [Oryza sativa Japonica Group]|uniref:Os07g0600300 protein n=2 Tax=Oryza sativa subsp. japonica TaxID=39947 RepID=Q0D4W3_ORYSJ|nr:APO protein 3, mitochondrial [Oryza sativa Japonica Group]BAF22110.1 Os07g0600300 [Oryza sativa Japonica Group]BAT02518.1 Os07g0600300 [Oryza sativa Japonica Group]|eukprot:NP_001060196.1 Os07g0600300 [Oryza sativa Japonica Group]
MPPSGLFPRRALAEGAGALGRSLPLVGGGSWTRLVHGGGGGSEAEGEEFPYADVPRPGRKWERKPYVTPMKVLIRRAKEERRARRENPCRVLERPPENGLLVPGLVGVAHQVHGAWESLLRGLTRLVEGGAVAVRRCRFCPEVHVGGVGHEIRTCEGPGSAARNALHVWRPGTARDVVGFPYCYHLFDRVGKPRVSHKEKYDVPRLPAILELCIQAGVDVERYPAKRRTRPVYSIEGRIVDFEPDDDEDDSADDTGPSLPSLAADEAGKMEEEMTVCELGARTLQSWLDMRAGAARLMGKYGVVTCGYCPEVQVGPKGHKVRMCKASKHQQRDGQHAWQEATVDDLVRPNYVWHVPATGHGGDGGAPPLANELKRYYGKAPAVVELCVRAGAPVPAQYRSMMRLDVVPPARDEHDLVA